MRIDYSRHGQTYYEIIRDEAKTAKLIQDIEEYQLPHSLNLDEVIESLRAQISQTEEDEESEAEFSDAEPSADSISLHEATPSEEELFEEDRTETSTPTFNL